MTEYVRHHVVSQSADEHAIQGEQKSVPIYLVYSSHKNDEYNVSQKQAIEFEKQFNWKNIIDERYKELTGGKEISVKTEIKSREDILNEFGGNKVEILYVSKFPKGKAIFENFFPHEDYLAITMSDATALALLRERLGMGKAAGWEVEKVKFEHKVRELEEELRSSEGFFLFKSTNATNKNQKEELRISLRKILKATHSYSEKVVAE